MGFSDCHSLFGQWPRLQRWLQYREEIGAQAWSHSLSFPSAQCYKVSSVFTSFLDSDSLNSLLPPSDWAWHPHIDPSKLYGPGEHSGRSTFRFDDLGPRKGSVLCVNRRWSICAVFTTQAPTEQSGFHTCPAMLPFTCVSALTSERRRQSVADLASYHARNQGSGNNGWLLGVPFFTATNYSFLKAS